MVLSDSSQSFKNVLLIEYPRKGLYSLAFQTASKLGEVQGRTGDEVVCCFVPTTPNPTSGFIIIVPRKDVIVLDMAMPATPVCPNGSSISMPLITHWLDWN